MTSEVDLCNRALSGLGARSTISNLTEGSAESVQCALHYGPSRDELLRLHLWSFARRQKILALLAAAAGTPENPSGTGPVPLSPWRYQYQPPTNCLRIRQIYQPVTGGAKIAYALSGDEDSAGNPIDVILTDQPQAVLIYTARISAVDVFPPDFQAALVATLAAKLAIPLTGDKASASYFAKVAQDTILTSRSIDGSEDPSGAAKLPEWLAVRGYADVDSTFINSLMG